MQKEKGHELQSSLVWTDTQDKRYKSGYGFDLAVKVRCHRLLLAGLNEATVAMFSKKISAGPSPDWTVLNIGVATS